MSDVAKTARQERLRSYLGQAGFRRVVALARERVEHHGKAKGAIKLPAISPDEIRCLSGLLGQSWRAPMPGTDVSLNLAKIDRALERSSFAVGLTAALEAVGGPLQNHQAARQDLRDSRTSVWDRAAAHPGATEPQVAEWLANAQTSGGLSRLAYEDDGTALLLALDASQLLPCDPPEAQSVLAARLQGSAHALDFNTGAGKLLVSLLAWRAGEARPTAAAARRDLLDRFGVLTDSISCAVVVLNLPVAGDGLVAKMTALASGRHLSLTLGNLTCEPLAFLPSPVYLCENPTILREAERRLGAVCPPLVCGDGQFNTACLRLLEALQQAGCTIHVHGDFDWGGLHIVSRAIQTVGATPWRYNADAYLQGLETGRTTPLSDRRPIQLHDSLSAVAEAIGAEGRGVHEEAVLDELVSDLAAAGVSQDSY